MISHERRTPDRVLVVGLDGATFDLIEPWAAEGKLPAIFSDQDQATVEE